MQTEAEVSLLKRRLRAAGLSLTGPRAEVFRILRASAGPVSIQEVIEAVDGIHFVSVYRSIDALIKAGVTIRIPIGFKNKYELSEDFKPHHHHAVCERCGGTWSVEDERAEALMRQLAAQAGLTPTRHHFELYGVCADCGPIG